MLWLIEADGDTENDTDTLGLMLALGDTEGETDTDGETLAEGETEAEGDTPPAEYVTRTETAEVKSQLAFPSGHVNRMFIALICDWVRDNPDHDAIS